MKTLEDALHQAEEKLSEKDYAALKAVVDAYAYLTELVDDKTTTIARLRQMLFGASTEKTATVVGGSKDANSQQQQDCADPIKTTPEDKAETSSAPAEDGENVEKTPRKGHGRNGADAYTGAERIEVRHESLQPGDPCPKCEEGTVYETNRPGVLVRLKGQPPLGALMYYLQKLRCNLCGTVFTAEPPEDVGGKKYDATAGSMTALLKYGTGVPFNREEQLQKNLGVPLPASTQWDIVAAQAKRAESVFEELIRQAAAGEVVHNDDTGVKILELMDKQARQAAWAEEACDESETENSAQQPAACRKGMFTTGVVSTQDGHKIALFLSGHQHAGENLKDVLKKTGGGSASADPNVRRIGCA